MKTVYIINSQYFGSGDEALGSKLMGAFLKKIWARSEKPDALIFYNSGVKLLTKQSMVLDALHGLSDAGVDLVACGTCINDYQLKDDVEVGRISGMEEIVDMTMNADRCITV